MLTRAPSKLDSAIVLSVALMVAFNLAALVHHSNTAPRIALVHSADRQG